MVNTKKKMMRGVTAAGLSVMLLAQPILAAGPVIPDEWVNPFTDIAMTEWYTPCIADLHSRKVVNGYPDGRFGPLDNASVGQAVLMVLRAAGIPDPDPSKIGTLLPHYAAAHVKYAADRKWLDDAEGVPSNLEAPATRLYVAHLTAKALDLEPSEQPSPFADLNDPLVTALYEAGVMAGVEENGVLNFLPQKQLTRSEISAIVWNVMDYMEDHIRFRDYVVDILEGVPVLSYDLEGFQKNGERMTYTGATDKEQVWGIDVSAHQEVIDWQKVAASGVEFAMIRVGYRGYVTGALKEDAYFRQNIEGALAAGLEVGVYVFSQAITVQEVEEEAQLVLDMIRDYNVTGPVVFDWESISSSKGPARTDGMDGESLTYFANHFCQLMEQAGYSPMIYFNQTLGYLRLQLEDLVQYPFWLADYNDTPQFYYNFDMWQYTSQGKIDGIEGRVDMNLWFRPTQK